ncbi:MAG: CHAT domain-containing protein [Anaerolinea sp.]|nr:CHAT domain-containing protein [Anaerolinea sp.]
MNTNEALLQAIDQLWPELPILIGETWPQFEAQLAPLLAQVRSDPAGASTPAAQIMALFAGHGEAHIRLMMAMQALNDAAEQAAIKGFTYGVTQPAAAAPAIRYTDIACPRRVWLGAARVAVVVRLTVTTPQASASVQALTLDPAQPVQVRLAAPGFILLSPPVQPVEILPDADSAPLVFDLRPDVAGHTTLTFDFAQGNQPVGVATVPVEITAFEVIEGVEPRPAGSLAFQPGLASPDLVLHIALEKDALVFSLLREGGAWWRTFPPVPLQQAPAAYATEFYRAMTSLVEAEDPTVQAVLGRRLTIPAEDVDRRLKKLGQNLWKLLIPDELKALYAAERAAWASKTLLIQSDEPHLPWELVWPYDPAGQWSDELPWCGTLLMTRWLRKDGRGNGNETPPGALALKRLIVLAPSYSLLPDLAGAQREQEALHELAISYGLRVISPTNPTWGQVLDLLEGGGYDWVHAAAHGNFYATSPDGDSALWLARDRALTPEDVVGTESEAYLRSARPGFFFNACQVGRQGWALTRMGGWANRLISAGAGLFIGPLWEVLDESALTFAREFYSALLADETVASATRRARLAARAAGDPTWLAYSVYAHPNARLKRE